VFFIQLVLATILFVGLGFGAPANLRLLPSEAVTLGAVCIDGTPGGYYLRNGTGNGANKWIIHMEGGGYCIDGPSCADRSKGTLGSSKTWPKVLGDPMCCWNGGILADDAGSNPDFYNWNLVFLGYCDGSFFTGNRADPVTYNNEKLYFRGKRLLDAISADLLANAGLNRAQEVIVTGCSAGGVATYIQLDLWRNAIPQSIPVHGLADAGYLLDHTTIKGEDSIGSQMRSAFTLWNAYLHPACVAANTQNPWKCLFAPQTYPYIKTPIFLLQGKYDSWQIQNILQISCLGWVEEPKCNGTDLTGFMEYGAAMLSTLTPAINSPKDGIWLSACTQHCQSVSNANVLAWTSIRINGVTARDGFANWYYKRSNGKYVDTCTWNINTCNPCGFK